jgi:glycosyltransferase involved in cell wall biosynthesis
LPKILHLTYDYVRPGKTSAVSKLINVTQELSTAKVISLYRVVKRRDEIIESDNDGIVHLKSFGLPYGLFLLRNLRRTCRAIESAHERNLLNLNEIDLIHAHKLTYEGYLGYLLARKRNLPLIISLRQTDFFVLKYRPDLMPKIRKILEYSTQIFYIMPYMVNALKNIFGEKFYDSKIKNKVEFLPNIIDKKPGDLEACSPQKFFFTALRMSKESVRRKNLKNLLKVLGEKSDLDYDLYIAGNGEYLDRIKNWANKYNISHKVKFLGKIPNNEMDKFYSEATAFVMPSFSETFGMVYAESLLNGTPILYSKGTGFDGVFKNVGVAVDPNSLLSIGEGLDTITERNRYFRKVIFRLNQNNAFHIFSPQHARDTYAKILNRTI